MFFSLSLSLSSLFTSLTFSQNGSPKIKRKAVSVLAPFFFSLLFRPHERTTTSAKSLDFIIHRVDGVNRKKKKRKSRWWKDANSLPRNLQRRWDGCASIKEFFGESIAHSVDPTVGRRKDFSGDSFSSLLARSWWIRIWSHSSIRGSTIHPR
jgi:hypothetical protein